MKKLRCENSTGSGKYFTGHVCNSIVEVAETSEKVIAGPVLLDYWVIQL